MSTAPDATEPIEDNAQDSGENSSASAGLEFLEPAVVDAGLSVLARKMRTELIVGLLEDFVAGRRSAQNVTARVRIAAEAMHPPGADGSAATGEPLWKELRTAGRQKGRPVIEWEIFSALQTAATRKHGSRLTVDALEKAVVTGAGLDPRWSLHTYLADARDKLGPRLAPRPEEVLGGALLHVDLMRKLAKPGGISIDVGITDPALATKLTPQLDRVRQLLANDTGELNRKFGAALAVDLLAQKVPQADIATALQAGNRIVAADAAAVWAQAASAQAQHVRARRIDARARMTYLAGAGLGAAGAVTSALRGDLASLLAASSSAMACLGRAFTDWGSGAQQALIAPFEAWYARRRAARADRVATRAINRVFGVGAQQVTPQSNRPRGVRR